MKHLVWIDLETTGLDTGKDRILEVGSVATDLTLTPVGEPYHAILHLPSGYDWSVCDDFVIRMHQENNLWKDSAGESAVYLDTAMRTFGEWLSQYLEPDINGAPTSPMCGSSVHFDRAMLRYWMPEIEQMFHYRNLDVSTFKIAMGLWDPAFKLKSEDRKIHRVLPDLEDTLEEMREYKNWLFAGVE